MWSGQTQAKPRPKPGVGTLEGHLQGPQSQPPSLSQCRLRLEPWLLQAVEPTTTPLGLPPLWGLRKGDLPSPPAPWTEAPLRVRLQFAKPGGWDGHPCGRGKKHSISWDRKGRSCEGGRWVEWARAQPRSRGHPVPPPCPLRESCEANRSDHRGPSAPRSCSPWERAWGQDRTLFMEEE